MNVAVLSFWVQLVTSLTNLIHRWYIYLKSISRVFFKIFFRTLISRVFSFILFLQHEVYRNNESVAPNPRNPLEDYTIHCVDIEVGVHCDSLKFKNDKIFLSHNQGIYLHKDVLAILSVQHQTIHVYQLDTDLGGFCPIVSIGKLYL